MNNTMMRAREGSLSGVEKKVLAAVPISDTWSSKDIAKEIWRLTGSRPEQRAIDGSLESLRESKLVRETRPGHFQRVAYKEESPVSAPEKQNRPALSTAGNPITAVDKAAAAAERCRSIATLAIAAANEIEEAALELAQETADAEAKAGKLAQLKTLLRDLA